MEFQITHRTVYEYAEPVAVSHHAARVKPRLTNSQERADFSLRIQPEPAVQTMRTDYFGNRACYFSIQQIHRRLEVNATSRVSVRPVAPPALASSADYRTVAEMFRDPVSPEVVEPYQFRFDSPFICATPELAEYARESFRPDTPLLLGVQELNGRIHADFTYDPVATTVSTPLAVVIAQRRGVCQDFAHLAIACLRSLGLAARYVSGYLRTHASPADLRLVGADASHAWFSVFCPNAGWVDFDPTNNLMPAEEHITVAYGRDFGDVSPVSGILVGGGSHEIKVGVEVKKIEPGEAESKGGTHGRKEAGK
jgi:transglutaminase-like putative cysteine protease